MKSPLPLLVFSTTLLLTIPACSTLGGPTTLITSSAQQQVDPETPLGAARQEALLAAETSAREQLLEQIYAIPLNDGRTLGDLAIVDPSVNGVILDTVATAGIDRRRVDDNGIAQVTLEADLQPLYEMITYYQGPAI